MLNELVTICIIFDYRLCLDDSHAFSVHAQDVLPSRSTFLFSNLMLSLLKV